MDQFLFGLFLLHARFAIRIVDGALSRRADPDFAECSPPDFLHRKAIHPKEYVAAEGIERARFMLTKPCMRRKRSNMGTEQSLISLPLKMADGHVGIGPTATI